MWAAWFNDHLHNYCSLQSENLRNLKIALRILRILRLHSQFRNCINHMCTIIISICNLHSQSPEIVFQSRDCAPNLTRAQSQDHIIYMRNLDIYVRTVSTFPLRLIVSDLACRMEVSLISMVCLHRRHIAIWKVSNAVFDEQRKEGVCVERCEVVLVHLHDILQLWGCNSHE